MRYEKMREELKSYYWPDFNVPRAKEFSERCFSRLDAECPEGLSVMEQKLFQYKIINEEVEPVLFPHCPFYFETGALSAHSDGARNCKNGDFYHAAGWVYFKNKHIFKEQDLELYELKKRQSKECLYLIGTYNDSAQHFNFNNRPILTGGLRSIYEEAKAGMSENCTAEEREYLHGVCEAMLALRTLAEKFSESASKAYECETDAECAAIYKKIADTAKRVPWEAPKTLYEALCTLAFMRKALGTLEGVGPNTFGRLDLDLYPFYKSDIESGRLTADEAFELICQFLIIWDMHYDHDLKMVGYADHELENTYTIGGCDADGKSLCNELTLAFLRATREEKIIFPKIKCRFSSESPKEYLDEIAISVINGTSTILYQNDEATIAAAVRGGRPVEEARDYMVSGCWGIAFNTEKYDHGSYLNLLKAFEIPLHKLTDKMKEIELDFLPFDNAKSFEEFYSTVVENSRILMEERIRMTREGGQVWNKVDAYPIFSSTLEDCLKNKRDFISGGGRYRDDFLLCFGLPNIIDSLLVVKKLCFDEKLYTLAELLTAVRNNWQGYEDMRALALRTTGWGDGGEESCALANRFNNDLFAMAKKIKGSYGGQVHIGHLTYTEIRWWGEKTLATPDGRYSGDYFSQGLTPSRLKKISSATNVINSLASLDASTMAANNVVNIILPATRMSLDVCEAFVRACAKSSIMSLQLNCTTKEQLLDAQKNPQNYPDLIVRVCGFSAKFTSLTPEWQNEVLTRNFYD